MKEIELKGIDEKYYYEELENGLPIIMWVNNKVNNFYITLSCKYGSIDTEFKLKGDKEYRKVPNGIAHFLEHVNFNLPGDEDATNYFNKLGSNCNAFTTFEYTSYEVFASSCFKENLNHLLNYVYTPYFTKKNVKKEKGIIIEEVRMGKNNPGSVFYYGANNSIYVNDKKKYLVCGEVEDVQSITHEDLNLVFDNFYHPKNMFLTITGNFDPEEAVEIVKENMNNKEFSVYLNPVKKRDVEPVDVNIPYKEEEGNVELPKVKIAYKMDRKIFGDIDDLQLRVYLGIILRNNFGNTSLFKEELLEKDLITGLGYEREVSDDVVIISLVCETKYPAEVIDKIREKLNNLSINEKDLKRRIKCNIASLIYDYDNIEDVNGQIQDDIIVYDRLITDMYDIYSNLNIELANKILKHLVFDREAIYILKPTKKD